MTLQQLIGGDATTRACRYLPQLAIHDRPRTRMRELMVDPARIFLPFDDLRALLPEMARYKYNALHLHLVDDQAWRIEIKQYPQLVEKAATRTGMDDMLLPISGYYTQEQMKQLVAEAARYHIDIIPEIEMPGHEVAAIHCFPQLTCGAREVPLRTTCGVSNELLCPGEDFVYEFLGNVFGELAEIFPSRYIHLGGDEAGSPALGCWTDCDKCRTLKRRLGIDGDDRSDNWRLQQYLFDRIIDTLRTRYDKTPMFWYETDFKTIQPGCITFAWRHGLTAAAIDAARSNDARIMLCPGEHCYLDYPMAPGDMPEVNWGMPVTSLQQTYRLDPAWGRGEDFEQRHLFGVAGTLWSECITSTERLYYQAFPRALALAEAGWSPQKVRRWDDFLRRLTPRLRDMQRRGIDFSPRF
jgi:hexosaminidase